MSWQDRAYNREDSKPRGRWGGMGAGGGGNGGFGSGFNWRSMTAWLMIANVAVFFLNMMTAAQGTQETGALYAWGFFSYNAAISHGQVWRFITFQFLHANGGHIFFNMLAIYFFGPLIEQYLGSRRYLAYYLICGVAGTLMYMLLYGAGILVAHPGTPMVGASAGIFGILAGAAIIAPDVRVMLLIPPIPMKLRTMAWVFLGIAVFVVLTNGSNAGGQAAHLGGAVAGFLLIRQTYLLNFADLGSSRKTKADPKIAEAGNPAATDGHKAFGQRVTDYRNEREQKKQAALEKEIDRILIKVKDKGLQSLSESEKRTLQQETNRKRQS